MRRFAITLVLAAFACGGEPKAAVAPPVLAKIAIGPLDAGVLAAPRAPAFRPKPGTVAFAVVDNTGNVSTGEEGPESSTLARLIAPCHAAGRPTGHAVLAIEDDENGAVHVTDVLDHVGIDVATISCIRQAIEHAAPSFMLAVTVHGSGRCYVGLY